MIIGGSLVGLSAALFLARRGVATIVIEKHHDSAPHPRAMGFTERTMEHYRAAGIGERIAQVPPQARLRRVRADSLTGAWRQETEWTPGETQERRASASPCGEGVTAQVRVRDSGAVLTLRAAYLIGADGAGSPVRTALGIERQGIGHLRTLRSILFRCPGAEPYLARGITQFDIEQPGFKCFLTTYGDGRWALMFDQTQPVGDDLVELVRRALGQDLAVEVLATGRWELAGRIADRFSQGRVFLAGDAAHQLPPTRGGFGANTGIDDAANLAWKLSRVVQRRSSPLLLDTYDAECRPIAWLRHQQTLARPDYAQWAKGTLEHEALFGNEAMELGQLQRSAAILGAGPALPAAAHPDQWAGQPGTRMPHVWIEAGGRTLSTLDLATDGFVLLAQDRSWIDAARAQTGPACPLRALQVGVEIVFPADASFEHRFGVAADGAVLVRPDALIAWRASRLAADPARTLADAIKQVAMLA
nr:FAD-dependent monooxygenase [Massilia genomosp. 1]